MLKSNCRSETTLLFVKKEIFLQIQIFKLHITLKNHDLQFFVRSLQYFSRRILFFVHGSSSHWSIHTPVNHLPLLKVFGRRAYSAVKPGWLGDIKIESLTWNFSCHDSSTFKKKKKSRVFERSVKLFFFPSTHHKSELYDTKRFRPPKNYGTIKLLWPLFSLETRQLTPVYVRSIKKKRTFYKKKISSESWN